MLHIPKYLGAVLLRVFEDWGKQEVVIAFLAYVFLVGIVFGAASFGVDSSTERDSLLAKVIMALSIAAVILLILNILILTPARMWDEALREIKDLQEKVDTGESTAVRFDVKSEEQQGGQTAGVIQNVGPQPRALKSKDDKHAE